MRPSKVKSMTGSRIMRTSLRTQSLPLSLKRKLLILEYKSELKRRFNNGQSTVAVGSMEWMTGLFEYMSSEDDNVWLEDVHRWCKHHKWITSVSDIPSGTVKHWDNELGVRRGVHVRPQLQPQEGASNHHPGLNIPVSIPSVSTVQSNQDNGGVIVSNPNPTTSASVNQMEDGRSNPPLYRLSPQCENQFPFNGTGLQNSVQYEIPSEMHFSTASQNRATASCLTPPASIEENVDSRSAANSEDGRVYNEEEFPNNNFRRNHEETNSHVLGVPDLSSDQRNEEEIIVSAPGQTYATEYRLDTQNNPVGNSHFLPPSTSTPRSTASNELNNLQNRHNEARGSSLSDNFQFPYPAPHRSVTQRSLFSLVSSDSDQEIMSPLNLSTGILRTRVATPTPANYSLPGIHYPATSFSCPPQQNITSQQPYAYSPIPYQDNQAPPVRPLTPMPFFHPNGLQYEPVPSSSSSSQHHQFHEDQEHSSYEQPSFKGKFQQQNQHHERLDTPIPFNGIFQQQNQHYERPDTPIPDQSETLSRFQEVTENLQGLFRVCNSYDPLHFLRDDIKKMYRLLKRNQKKHVMVVPRAQALIRAMKKERVNLNFDNCQHDTAGEGSQSDCEDSIQEVNVHDHLVVDLTESSQDRVVF